MAVSPREDFIVVQESGDDNEHDLLKATVVAVGPGLGDLALDTQIGDVVVFGKSEGETVRNDGRSYIVVRDSKVRVKL